VDAGGSIYIADTGNHRIRRITPDGTISSLYGGSQGFGGDGGSATAANLNSPSGLAFDTAGNLYIVDTGNHRIRRVSTSGIITTVAGNGTAGFGGDGGPATAARLNGPGGVATDSSGNVYIADTANNRVRRVSTAGVIETVAGTGQPGQIGDNLRAVLAQLEAPAGLAVDGAGNLYIAETRRIRRVTPGGIILTVAGGSDVGFSGDGGPATSAQLDGPQGMAIDTAGNLYVADSVNHRIRRITPAGSITTMAGGGDLGDGAPATAARFYFPRAIVADQSGSLYVADHDDRRIRRLSPDGLIRTVAGDGTVGNKGDGGPAAAASFNSLFATAIDSAGNLYVADISSHRVRKISTSGIVSIVVGTGRAGFSGDGGPATAAQLYSPSGLAFDTAGNLYISEAGNARVRRVTPAGIITTFAGDGTKGYGGDGGPATAAQMKEPCRLTFDSAGNLYIADRADQRVRRVSPSGIITAVAGNGTIGGGGDNGPATAAQLQYPAGLTIDAGGNLYIAVLNNHRVRKVTPAGIITTIAGTGAAEFGGDGGMALAATLWSPTDVLVDASGTILVLDGRNRAVRKLTPIACTYTLSLTSSGVVSAAGSNGLRVSVGAPLGCSWTATSNAAWITITSAPSGNGEGAISYSVAPNTGSTSRTGTLTIAGQTFTVTQASPSAPTFTAAGITNGASFAAGVAPGSIATIFGTGLTKGVNGIVVADRLPLPTQLAGTSVTIGGVAAPLFAVANVNGSEQINLQVPYEVAGMAAATVAVNNNGEAGAPVQVTILPAHPGIFTIDGKAGAILHGANNALVTPSNPAARDEIVVIYATGLGPLRPASATGMPAPTAEPLALTTSNPSVTVAGTSAEVLFSGLAPGFVGLYQVNIRIPPNTPAGSALVMITAAGASSNTVLLAVSAQ
jgi:uncharacterized protein (TIGR03437 family)